MVAEEYPEEQAQAEFEEGKAKRTPQVDAASNVVPSGEPSGSEENRGEEHALEDRLCPLPTRGGFGHALGFGPGAHEAKEDRPSVEGGGLHSKR